MEKYYPSYKRKGFTDTVRKMEKCSTLLSVTTDNKHISLYHLTAGNYEYDMADHNYTRFTYGLTNSTLSTAKQNWEFHMAKLRETQITKRRFYFVGVYTTVIIYFIWTSFLNISSLVVKEKKPSRSPTEWQNWTNCKVIPCNCQKC